MAMRGFPTAVASRCGALGHTGFNNSLCRLSGCGLQLLEHLPLPQAPRFITVSCFHSIFFLFHYLALSESSLCHVGSFITAHGLSSCGLRAQ